MDVEAVCRALANQARQIDTAPAAITAYDHFPLSVSEPAFIIADVQVTYDEAYNRGLDQLRVTAALLLARADDKAAARRLYGFVSSSSARSAKQVLEADPTLGGTCEDMTITSSRIPRVLTIGKTDYWAAEFTITIDG